MPISAALLRELDRLRPTEPTSGPGIQAVPLAAQHTTQAVTNSNITPDTAATFNDFLTQAESGSMIDANNNYQVDQPGTQVVASTAQTAPTVQPTNAVQKAAAYVKAAITGPSLPVILIVGGLVVYFVFIRGKATPVIPSA